MGPKRNRLRLKRGIMLTAFAIAVCIYIYLYGAQRYPVRRLVQTVQTLPSADAAYKEFYADVKCVTERSNSECSIPLLTDYHRRCGYFPGLTSWENISAGFPRASMSAQICRVLPVSSAPQRLHEYITERNISSIAVFGDSQGKRYNKALLQTFTSATFNCTLQKSEPPGERVHLNYYTMGSISSSNDTVPRTCKTCNSELNVCLDKDGHGVSVEYITMSMAKATPLDSHCNDTRHPLCQNITLQEYVFQHYLRRENNYPQLLLFFSAFGHDQHYSLSMAFDGIRYLHGLITSHVPASSAVIWYNVPGWHALKHPWWFTSEGRGYSPNDKMQAQNHFLSKLQILHHESGNTPPMYSFFDLYHMDEQLRGAWDADLIHFEPPWYAYVVGYTATMLPSLPL